MFRCKYEGLKRAFRGLRLAGASGAIGADCAGLLARRVRNAAAEKTPVRTGTLKRGFDAEAAAPVRHGRVVWVTVTNPVAHASFVEYGHRTKGGGWKPGRFMLTSSAAAASGEAPALAAAVRGALEEAIGDGA